MRKTLVPILLLGFMAIGPTALGQVKIAKVLSSSKINHYETSHLVLIDFWATWCKPCINIGRQLEVTQEIFKEDLTIISLSRESEATVQKFIDTHHPKLTMALDSDSQTFKHFEVNKSLPYSVLLDQRGGVLWKGHPGNLSNDMIDMFVRNCEPLSGSHKRFITLSKEKDVPEVRSIPHVSSKGRQFSVTSSPYQDSYFIVSEEGIKFSGRCSKLFSEILKASQHDIVVENDRYVHASIGILNWNMGADIVLYRVLGELGMTREVRSMETEYYSLTLIDPGLLWDSEQLNLADYNGAFMIGTESVSLDNASVEEFAFRLSDVMDHPVYTGYDSPTLHDWHVHYKYPSMTEDQLEHEYGIGIELRTGTHQVHFFK